MMPPPTRMKIQGKMMVMKNRMPGPMGALGVDEWVVRLSIGWQAMDKTGTCEPRSA